LNVFALKELVFAFLQLAMALFWPFRLETMYIIGLKSVSLIIMLIHRFKLGRHGECDAVKPGTKRGFSWY